MKSECNLLPTRWAHVCVYVYICVRVRETDRQTHSGQANLQTKTEFKAQEIESIKINENQFWPTRYPIKMVKPRGDANENLINLNS